MENKNAAIFLDRDGTLIVEKDYLSDPDKVELLPDVKDFIKEAKARGYLLFMHTNQSGIGRGYYAMEDAVACNQRMFELIGLGSDLFQEICLAPETPDQEPIYRKPSAKFFLEMIEQFNLDHQSSWMIGDKHSDIKSGVDSNLNTAWVATGKPLDDKVSNYCSEHSIPKLEKLGDLWNLVKVS